MKHDSDTILRQAILRDLTVAAIAAGWSTGRIAEDVPHLAAVVFGPLPIVDSKLALDLDKALHETAAAPAPAPAAQAGTGEGPQSQPVPAARFIFNAVAKCQCGRKVCICAKPADKEVGEAALAAVTTTPTNEGGDHVTTPARDGGAKASNSGPPPLPTGPIIEITSPQMNVLEAMCQMADKGNTSPTISQLTLRSGEPSVPYQLKGLIDAKCIKNSGQIGAPAYVILRRFDDPNVRRRPMQARHTKPTGNGGTGL